MANNSFNCGLEAALAVIGGKWKPLVLFNLAQNVHRYGELRRAIGGVTDKVLIQQLKELERILFAFNDDRVIVYGFDSDRKEWDALDMSLLPNEITKEKLLTAAKDGKLGTKPKAWRDLVVDGERLNVNLNE